MSSKRNLRRKECGKKVRFNTHELACKSLWKIKRRNTEASVYHCKWCNGWHIGHYKMETGFLSRKEKLACN